MADKKRGPPPTDQTFRHPQYDRATETLENPTPSPHQPSAHALASSELLGNAILHVEKDGDKREYITVAEIYHTTEPIPSSALNYTDVSLKKVRRVMSAT